ncbi:uncharacterized protein LOC131627506 [Vicia villosa]|uniref:uncharacterized protein LOC131627506 n=1 Tax=Vicia villosa TaxID=3911 RepID=UPI00273B99DA|nr:uncharacterized protein LOC131627506 [Vicia villosa]
MKLFYQALHHNQNSVSWRALMNGNLARPRAIFQLWIACHSRLPTKSILVKWGMIDHNTCNFCNAEETQKHLLFECKVMNNAWRKVLQWINVDQAPLEWNQEMTWLVDNCKGKSKKADILKLAATESIYEIWKI